MPHFPCGNDTQDLRNTPELIALAVNLTQNGRNAEVRCRAHRSAVCTLCAMLGALLLTSLTWNH